VRRYARERRKRILEVSIALVCFSALGILLFFLQPPAKLERYRGPRIRTKTISQADQAALGAHAVAMVRSILKHPDDAVFSHPAGPIGAYRVEAIASNRYAVAGRVKAPNDLGAVVTKRWRCVYDVPGYDVARAELLSFMFDGDEIVQK